MSSDTTDNVMSPSSSSPSRLMELLDRTRNEIQRGIQSEQSNRDDGMNDGEGDNIVDINGITDDIQQFTMSERGNEFRDCARYNDYVILHTILYVTAVASQDYDTVDTAVTSTTPTKNPGDLVLELLYSRDAYTGNTALHMASANNHFNIVQFLLQIEDAIRNDNVVKPSCASTVPREEQALRLVQCTNTSGKNTPLHYAVTNRALESIRFLLQDYSGTTTTTNTDTSVSYTNPYIDVLQQNSAGRSSLTEAFALTSSSTANESDHDDDTKQNHEILTLLLEHPSANEERLIQTSSTNDGNHTTTTTTTTENAEEPNQTEEILPPCHTHHFRLVGSSQTVPPNDGIELYIREMAMAPTTMSNAEYDDPPDASLTTNKTEPNNHNNDLIHILGGTEPVNDTTGYGIWSASIIMGQWMTDVFYNNRHTSSSEETAPIRTILELGAGCGIPGITVAKSFVTRTGLVPNRITSMPPTVYVTDLNPLTLRNLQHNVTTNHVEALTRVVSLDWNELIQSRDDTAVWPWTSTNADVAPAEGEPHGTSDTTNNGIDVLIGSDLVYQKEVVPILLETIHKLRPKTFYYGAAGTNRDGHDLFIQSLQTTMTLVSSFPAPTNYRTTNPLHNQDDDECFIHFQDLLLLSNPNRDNDCENGNDGIDDAFTLYEFANIIDHS